MAVLVLQHTRPFARVQTPYVQIAVQQIIAFLIADVKWEETMYSGVIDARADVWQTDAIHGLFEPKDQPRAERGYGKMESSNISA